MLIILSQQIYFRLLSDITYEKRKINTYVLYKYSFYMAIKYFEKLFFLNFL